ncbi:hypothetical protein J3R82DRAFT_3463 [Butyriboletus roseoflavus]|nr:hypothetical protein J3R82DRAFT_3463 [Butyriboletus roseoflavus]
MLFLITAWIALSALYGQETWVIQSDYPGGAGAFCVSNETGVIRPYCICCRESSRLRCVSFEFTRTDDMT